MHNRGTDDAEENEVENSSHGTPLVCTRNTGETGITRSERPEDDAAGVS